MRVGTGGCHVGSWVDGLAAPFCRDWDVPLIEVEWLICETIEEAARRCRNHPSATHAQMDREMIASAIEAMLTDETQRGGGR